MADNRCFNADIISTILLGNNEGFAKEMVQLSQKKNAIQSLAWDTAKWKAQIKQIDMQIQSMFEARILYGSAWDEAKQALIKRLKARWGTIWAWARVLEMIDSISVNNINEYAELLGKQRGDVVNTQQAIDELKEAVSDFIAAKEWLKVNYWAKVFNKNLSMKERRKALWDWYKQELETVKKWWVPTTIVSPDDQWKHIERFTWAWQHKREELFNNYLLWRIFIWEDEDVTKDFIKEAKKFSNTLPKLTIDKINEYKNINTLLNRVYTNALDIARSPELRKALKLKIIELIHNGKTPNSVMKKAMSISNSMLLADSWVSFSALLKYDNVDRAVRSILIDENGKSRVSEELTSEDLYNGLKKILAKDNLKKSLVGRDWAKKIEAFWTKIDWEELLKIIYAASWDNDVKSAIELHWTIPDNIIIDAAKFRLFWLDTKNWEKNLRDIIAAFKKPYSPDEVSTIAFVATSWKPVKPSVNNKIAFVHFDDTNNLTLEDGALMSRAKFNDDLAWVNTLTVTTDGIRTYDITNWVDSVPTDLEYIVIPNANVRNSRRMQELRDRLEKQWKNNKYMIIYPRSRQSGQYFVDTDWKLKFKTTNTKLFNEMSNALAINSFNNATIDLTENTLENRTWTQLSTLEKKNKLNDSAVEFFKNYLWIKGKISDEQIIQKISNMTGIPLNPAWGNSAEAWEQAQRTLFLNYTMSWKFGKEIKTKWELNTIENSIRWMSYNDIFKEISDMWYSYNKKNVIKNISAIREALINMKTTDNLASYMWNKWIIMWLSNKWAVDNLTVERFKSILVSDNPLAQLADIFFWWRKTTKKEVEAMATYMSDITDALIWDFMTRLTEDWYQLPMISPRKAFVSYLKWELSVTDEFVQAFAYKNWLDENYNYIKQIFDDHMPSDIIVDGLITPETLQSIRWWNKWLVVKELSANERFLPTTYNSYTAVMGNMDIPAQTFPRQSVRITADETKEILRRFFTDKELEWVSINFYDNLIDWIAEGRYTSDWMRRALEFINNPEEVTPYHESVHMYIDMFLTKEQRADFLDEIYKKNKGAISKFAKDNWYVIDEALEKSIRERWETVQQYLTEEWVAENFIKFAKWEWAKLNKATRNWFQKLWDKIKSWVHKVPEEKLDSLNQFYSDVYNRARPEEATTNLHRNSGVTVKYRTDNNKAYWIKAPTRKELDEWLSKNSFTELLKKELWSTDDLEKWIFITKDWTLIKWISDDYDKYYRVWKWFWEYDIQMEHYWAIDSLIFNSRHDVWTLNQWSSASQWMYPVIADKEKIIRVRFFRWKDEWERSRLILHFPWKDLTDKQRRVLQEYFDAINDDADMWIRGQIYFEWLEWKYWSPRWWAINTDTWRLWLNNLKIQDLDNWKVYYPKDEVVTASNRDELEWREWWITIADINKPFTNNEWWKKHTKRRLWKQSQSINNVVENAWLTEEDVIRNILTKYEESVAKHIKEWTMTVKVAQDLKQQASYALNIAVQDLILSKYWNLLTASDREWLLWMWYWLKLAWNTNELNALKQANAELMWKFRTRWWELAQQNNQLFSNVDELNKQLMDSWRVYTQRNWIEAVVDVWDELENSIKSIPDTAWEFTELKKLSRQTIKWLKPRDAYVMLKVVDLVKNNITRWNFYTQLMYQLNPQLRKAVNWLDFFQSYKAVDVWGWVWVPWSLTSNATNWVVEAGKAVDDASDIKYKADITREIYENYIRVGKELTQKDLESIVKKVLKWTLNEWYAQHYVDSFAPYTSLKWLSNEVKTYINQLLNQESSDIQKLLKEAWADLDWIMATTVTLDDWSTVAIKDIVNWNVDWWKQRMFWWLSNRWDELYVNNQVNRDVQKELEWAYAWFNDVSVVEDNQAKATIQILWHARKILQRDTHTQKFIEFDNAIWWQNDILKWLMEFHVFWQWKAWMDNKYVNKLIKTWARRTVAALGWYSKWFFNKQLWNDVKKIYEVYYSKPLKELNQIATPNDWAHQVALEMAKYFKQLEQRLGSKNWATWVSVIPWVNIAFWNLWNIIRNINTAEWVTSLMNKIGNNQVIWLFKFAREWDSSYNRFLHDIATNKKSEKWLSNALDWRRTELIQWDRKEIQQKFNEMFGSNFSEWDVNIIIQWLWWYQIVNSTFWKVLNKINSYIWSAGRVTRMLMSYPFQLFTIHPQLFAYNVKADTFKEALWVEDLSIIRKLRKKYWVLEWTYVELNPKEEFKEWINAILWRDSDEIDNLDIKLDDWVLWLYWKTTSYVTKKYTIPQKIALFDSVRDNANNIIDASQAQTFKWLAFTKALQTNDYIKFMNAEAFDEFMQRSDISQAVKDKLLDRVNIYSNRIFNNMLGTWFSGLDKAYWAWAISDFFMWVLQTINFKWAWWTNMFRQTFEKILTMIKVWWNYALGNREVAEDIWRYAVNTPEWTNFTEALWWDLVWSWKMWKYAKNWNLPDDESEVEMMDFIWRVADNAELVSQQWQWLISFWWTRPVLAAVEATYDTRDKWAESIWYWAWAFINSFISNIWRWWKPWNLWVDAIMVAERDWIWAWWDYLRENFYTLSAWTMRYMIEEWYNAYWANTPLTNQRWWIPAFMIGNQYEGSDTAFSYKVKQYQTWEYLKNLFNKDERMYAAQNLSSMYNVSQFLKLWVNSVKAAIWLWANIVWADIPDWAKSKKWVYSLLDIQEDFANSPTFQNFIKTGKALPPDMKKRDKLIDVFVNAQYPWWYKAYDWLQNFKNTGHINWNKDKWYYYDQWLEEFYTKIDKMKPGEIDRIMKLYSSQYLWDPNSEEGRVTIYNWARSWLNEMTDDPNYNLYASALYKWNLNNIYYELLDTEASLMTEYRKSLWFSKEQAKVSRTDINNLDDVKDRINQQFINAFYDQMYRADSELMQNQIYQWIADELEPEVANWYFTQQPETNYAGNETGEMEWVLNSNIKSQLKDFIFIEKSIDDWRWEDALAKTAILTQSLNYDDEMWLIRASIVDFYADRIMNSDLSPQMKLSSLSWLIDNNEDVFTYDSELAEKYWDAYDAAVAYKNDVLHNVTIDEIDDLNDLAILLHKMWESDSKWTASKWVKLSSKLAWLSWKLASSPSGWKSSTKRQSIQWAAVPIKWLSAMGYKPAKKPANFNFEVIYKSKWYDPKTKTLWPITPPKKNKAVKGKSTRKMTQKEENELDLI